MNNSPLLRLLTDHRYLLLLLVFTSLILCKGMTPSFSSDDFVHLENNIHYKNLAAASEVFIKPYGREYRPLVRLSLWMNHQMGDTALPYKISNLLMHLLCVTLLYGLLLRLGVTKATALLASSIFALHPIHTTSVHFILGRTDLVAAVFYLATLYCVAGWKNHASLPQQGLTLTLFAAALLSKELSITLPVMMLAVLITRQKNLHIPTIFRSAIRLWPYVLLAIIYLLARLYQWKSMDSAVAVYTNFSPFNIVKNYVEWTFALFYPFDLYVAREWLTMHPALFATGVITSCLLFFVLATYIWWQNASRLLRSPLLWLGLIWLLVTLIPMSGGNSHRWYLYLPSAGLSLIFAAAWAIVTPNRRQLLCGLTLLILVIYSGESLRQSLIWNHQSDLNEYLLSEAQTHELREHDAIAIANMPLGYQSAFLFTHSSFEEALRVRYGKSPKIEVLNFFNLDNQNPLQVELSAAGVTFRTTPNAFRYFRLRDLRVFFDQTATLTQGEFTLKTDALDKAGRITSLSIERSETSELPFYYFDGKNFKRLNWNNK